MKKILILLVASLLCTAVVSAQDYLGSISGKVMDEQGRVISTAKVVVSSPALMGRRELTATDNGLYRAINLPPGIYTVTVSKENYGTYEHKNLTMRADLNIALNITLKVGEFEEIITIEQTTPIIDLENSSQQYNFDGEMIRALPLGDSGDYFDILRAVPGLSLDYNIDQPYNYFKVHGADAYYDNVFTLDGADMEGFDRTANSTKLNMDVIDDVVIQLTGVTAAAPPGKGAYVNIVTKSGGNEISGTVSGVYMPMDWNDTNVDGGTPKQQALTQAAATIGGPLIKDKLWYFASYRYQIATKGISRSQDTINNLKAFFPDWKPFDIEDKRHSIFVKGSYRPLSNHDFSLTFQKETGDKTFGGSNYTEDAMIGEGSGGPLFIGKWKYTATDNLFFDTSVSWTEKPRHRYGYTGSDKPSLTIYSSTYISGGNLRGSGVLAYADNYNSTHYEEKSEKLTIKTDAKYFIEDLWGSHELDFGYYFSPHAKNGYAYDYSREYENIYAVVNDPDDYTKGYSLFYRRNYDGSDSFISYAGRVKNYAGYINDHWTPFSNITINGGLRIDHIKASEESAGEIYDVTDFTMVSPNIGITIDPFKDGKNVIRASYQKRFEPIASLRGGYSAGAPVTYEYDNDLNGTFETVINYEQSTSIGTTDYTNQEASYSHDFGIGYTRILPYNIIFSVDYKYRQFRNERYSLDINNIITDDGEFLGVVDPTVGSLIQYTNNTWSYVEFQGIDIQILKDISHNLKLMFSFSEGWSELKGDWAPDDVYRWLQPSAFAAYGDASGYSDGSDNEPPMNYRFNAIWNAPWDFNVAASVVIQQGGISGSIYEDLDTSDPEVTKWGPQYLYQDGERISNPLFEERRIAFADRKEGRWRAPWQRKINLRFSRDFKIGGYRLQTALDLFNLLNSGVALYAHYSGTNINSSYYKQMRGVQTPRSAQLTVKVVF